MINIYTGKTDPLDLVKDYADKIIIQHLRKNGIDGFKVRDILMNSYGFPNFKNFPVRYTQEEKALDKKIDYAIRQINTLCNSTLLTKGELSAIRKIEARLKNKSFRFSWDTINAIRWKSDQKGENGECILGSSGSRSSNSIGIKIKNGKALLLMPCDSQSPKTPKQLAGVQMTALYNYIEQFYVEKHNQKEIFGLIRTLYKTTKRIDYSTGQIKKYIENNKKIYKNINHQRK